MIIRNSRLIKRYGPRANDAFRESLREIRDQAAHAALVGGKERVARAGWPEPEIPDRLEARLEERMTDIDAPVSDLSFLWDESARGPW